jgi:TolB protein
MNADGSNVKRLTRTSTFNYYPAWSPDGHRIAFVAGQVETKENKKFSKLIESIEMRTVTTRSFADIQEIKEAIFVMNIDGSGIMHLTAHSSNRKPAWSSDGERIAFVSSRDGNSEIYIMNVDDKGARNLTKNPEGDYEPSWY